jgi:competence protein ComEA
MTEPDQTESPSSEVTLRLHALHHIHAEVREQVRTEAWAVMRRQFRGAIVALLVLALATGYLLRHFGVGTQRSAGGVPVPPCAYIGPAGSTAAPVGAKVTPWPVRVYVSGAVADARVVALPPGSLVSDALEAVGGATADADLTALNLAEPLRDHQHVQVPRLSLRLIPTPRASGDTGSVPALIDINAATAAELETLPGIGPARADDIVAYRETHGPFEAPEELTRVPGIGPATYERLAPLITAGLTASGPSAPDVLTPTPFP